MQLHLPRPGFSFSFLAREEAPFLPLLPADPEERRGEERRGEERRGEERRGEERRGEERRGEERRGEERRGELIKAVKHVKLHID